MKLSRLFNSFVVVALLSAAPLFALSVAEITDITPKVDEPPVPIRTTAPDYPAELQKKKVEGIVSVIVVIDEVGGVIACEASKSTNEGFNESATKAVQKWKFKPAKLGGKTVKVKVTIPVRFSIEA